MTSDRQIAGLSTDVAPAGSFFTSFVRDVENLRDQMMPLVVQTMPIGREMVPMLDQSGPLRHDVVPIPSHIAPA